MVEFYGTKGDQFDGLHGVSIGQQVCESEVEEIPSQSLQVTHSLVPSNKHAILIRVGYGVYVKAKTSSLTGKPVPVLSLVEIGIQALAKLGIQAELGKSAKAYMEGKTTQMPVATVLDVGGARVSRKIGVGKQYVRYQQ